MRLNTHEEEVLGQTSPLGFTPHKPMSTDGPNGVPSQVPGCLRFGHHPADRHRESEIIGGAFHGG